MIHTTPHSPAAPGAGAPNNPTFRPLSAIPEPMRLAGSLLLRDLIDVAVGWGVIVGTGGLILLSIVGSTNNLPAAIALLLVSCFGSGFAGYVITKARGFA